MSNKKVYYCPRCNAIYRREPNEDLSCPSCKRMLIDTGYAEDAWISLPGSKKIEIKNNLSENYVDDTPTAPVEKDLVFSMYGARGRHISIYTDRVSIRTEASLTAAVTGNGTDGEKTIYYADCTALQLKDPGITLGYIQLESPGVQGNNQTNNFFNENTFTYDKSSAPADQIAKAIAYIKQRIAYTQKVKLHPYSPADEILKLKQLCDDGVITKEEFESKKETLLSLI